MGALVALLFGAYTIAKVLRDALFLAEFGPLALPYMYIAVAVAAAGFVWVESLVIRRYSRVGAIRFTQLVAIALSTLAALALPVARRSTIVFFYVWTGSQAMMLLPHFWALALDVWDSRRARDVFPLLGGCGLLGGLVGGGFAAWWEHTLGRVGLMWALSGLLVLAFALTRLVERHRARGPAVTERVSSTSSWTIILRSSYIKVLVVALALAVVVSTLVDFQFKVFIQHLYPDQHSLTLFLGKYYVGLNALSLLFQFSVAGWALRRIGLGPATGLQPLTAMLFTSWVAFQPVWWIVIALRWLQSIVFGTLGKSTSEIYYTAIHPRERRRIKPAVDTLVERWSDAAVGVLLILLLHVAGLGPRAVAGVTIALALAWVMVLFVLDRQYGRAFEKVLTSPWIEPAGAAEAIRTPSARRALLLALREGEERRIVLALNLAQAARHADIAGAVRACLAHASPAVRVAAVAAMQAMRLPDPAGTIESFLGAPDEALRRAAVAYLLALRSDRTAYARRLLDGDDATLKQYAVDALFDQPSPAPDALPSRWVEDRLRTGVHADLLLAARAAGVRNGNQSAGWLRVLLGRDDVEVQRVALASAARRPSRALLGTLLPLFLQPELSQDAQGAVAAIGDPAVAALERLLADGRNPRAQVLAARTLGRIATPRAIAALADCVRTTDARLRYLGLSSLSRMRLERRDPVIARAFAHKLFLRELADFRASREPAVRLATHPAAEVRQLAASFDESADMALERAFFALACWYEARPLAGALAHMRAREPGAAAPALEYLGQVLPRGIFRSVVRIFEEDVPDGAQGAHAASGEDVAEAIRAAWRWGDAWLRACAVRASRHAAALDPALFAVGPDEDPMVAAELAAREGRPC